MDIKRILAPIDFSEQARRALEEADHLASERGASLTVLHVHPIVEVALLDFTYMEPPENLTEICAALNQRLQEWTQGLRTPQDRIAVEVKTGSPVNILLDESHSHDLIIMGTRSRAGVSNFLIGSVAERVVRGATCSVLVVK